MNMKLLTVTLLSALGLAGCGSDDDDPTTRVRSVEFTETPAPATTDELARTYSTSVAKVTYQDGRVEERPLTYHVLFSVKDPIAEVSGKKYPAGQLYNYRMEPLLDPMGNPVVAETPDANSLLKVDGKLFLVTHYEYAIANTDNLFFSPKIRTLFIGEDSGMHINNFVWAYNVDTQQLTRIMSLTAGAESTGLQVVENLNGHAYIMSNAQHHGDFPSTINADLKKQLTPLIDKFNAPVGYIGGIPGL